jgi:hypothetical protein
MLVPVWTCCCVDACAADAAPANCPCKLLLLLVLLLLLLQGDPAENIPKLVQDTGAGLLVNDYSPLKLGRKWKDEVSHVTLSMSHMDHVCSFCARCRCATAGMQLSQNKMK